jgi:hypothetical protein
MLDMIELFSGTFALTIILLGSSGITVASISPAFIT